MKQLSLVLPAAIVLTVVSSALSVGDQTEFKQPDVVVLVMGGLGAYDQCSVLYTTVVALPKAQADLDKIASLGKWRISSPKGVTKSSGGPKPLRTTSITWQSQGIIGYANGTLPLEPFVTALKRFKFIEVGYLPPAGFMFRGLARFDNRFVSVRLKRSTNSYRYRIVVKDNAFAKLDLPLVQPPAPKPKPEEHGMALWVRIVLALAIGLACAAIAYLIVSHIAKRR
jgi:hypothetical protein